MTQLVQRMTCWIIQLVCEVDLANCKFVVKLMHELASSSSIELPIPSNNGSCTCAVSYSESVKSPSLH